jgi:hypothetical protein
LPNHTVDNKPCTLLKFLHGYRRFRTEHSVYADTQVWCSPEGALKPAYGITRRSGATRLVSWALWTVAIRVREKCDKSIDDRTYAGEGGGISYLVAGRKP